MVTQLADYQFEIDDVVFGIGAPVSIEGEGFNPGVNEFNAQDVENARTDSFSFGRDSVTPSLWTWEAHTDKARAPGEALAAVAELGVAWNDKELRRSPGLVKPLRYCIDGRTRVIFGRPRAFGQVMNNRMLTGYIPLNLEFQPADTLHYDDEIRTFIISGTPTISAGFSFPVTFPLTTLGDSVGSDSLPAFGGDAEAPFEVTFEGGTNPKLFTDDWEIGLEAELADGESVKVSTYPWGIRAIRSDGAKVAGLLTMRTRLTKARLKPEGEALKFSALDSDGTASCTIQWRPAYTTI